MTESKSKKYFLEGKKHICLLKPPAFLSNSVGILHDKGKYFW